MEAKSFNYRISCKPLENNIKLHEVIDEISDNVKSQVIYSNFGYNPDETFIDITLDQEGFPSKLVKEILGKHGFEYISMKRILE